jgi:hypothetical protein
VLAGAAALALAIGAWMALGGESPTPPEGVGSNQQPPSQDGRPVPPAPGGSPAAAPKNARVTGAVSAALGDDFELAAAADAPAGAVLRYAWTFPPALAAARGPTDAATLRLELIDGLPDLEVPVQVVVRAGDGPEVAVEHVVRIADAPLRQPLLGCKRLGSGWVYDRADAAWAEVPDAVAGLSCAAKAERRTVTFQLGEDAYWEWSGALESAEAENTPFAAVAMRFCWPASGIQIDCRRQGADGLSWTMAAAAVDFAGGAAAQGAGETKLQQVRERLVDPGQGGETRRALVPPLLQAYQQPSLMSDDPKADCEPRGWFAVRRLGGELQVRVGVDNKRPDGQLVVESRSEWATLPAPAGACRVELVVDKGIGRFFLTTR